MSLLSEKFSRFPNIDDSDLECHDTLDTSTLDTEMQSCSWRSQDLDFISNVLITEVSANPYYLESKQPYLTNSMRSLLMDWLMEISSEFYLKRETCYKAMSYVDRYLSESTPVKKEHFQLLGLTACFIAAKCEEISYPKMTDFIKAAGGIYTCHDVRLMERMILKTLKWKITQPTSITVCDWLMTQWDSYAQNELGDRSHTITLKDSKGYKKFREIVQLIDASSLDIGYLRFRPRIIAACSCYMILFKHVKEQKYAPILLYESYKEEYEEEYVRNFMDLFLNFVSAALEIFVYDEMFACGNFLNRFVDVQVCYEFPPVCKTGFRPENHYQEFLSFQTHNPLCVQMVQMKNKGNFVS